MPEYFIHDMQNRDRQMITRMCIDAIDKHLLHIVDEIYYGGALVGMNEFEWSKKSTSESYKSWRAKEEKQCYNPNIQQNIIPFS